MNEWREVKFSELAEIKYGKAHSKLADGNIPVYGSGGLMRYVDQYLYDDESILIPRKGTLNNVMYKAEPFWTVDTMFWTLLNKDMAFPKYLYYQLSIIDFAGMNVGSAVPSMTVPVLKDIDVTLPPLPEQKAIATVLSSLDDKIDLLHRQNETLEQMAEAMFRQWFVEEAEEEWEEVELGDLIEEVVDNRGKTPPSLQERTNYPLIEVNAINSSSCLVNYDVIRKYVSEETYSSWFRNHLEVNDIIISTVGTIGVFSIFTANVGCIAQNLIGIRGRVSPYFIYNYLKVNKEEILNLDIGGVQPSIKVPHLLSMKLGKPSNMLINMFHDKVKPMYDKVSFNQKQIQTLTQLRDTLLPKLMSGEVRVEM